MKRKQGEIEAMTILKSKGITFDELYCDDNSKKSMHDLRYSNGRFLEITHTCHNNSIVKYQNKYDKKSFEEQLRISEEAYEAYTRHSRMDYPKYDCNTLTDEGKKQFKRDIKLIKNHFGYSEEAYEAYIRHSRMDYPKDDCNTLTDEGKKQFKRDIKLIKNHFGYDVSNYSQRFSEFNCDSPIIECSSDNIIREITNDKGKKYSDGNTDLFIFVLEDEMESVKYLLETREFNGSSTVFLETILNSPFKVVYLCVWNFENQTYNIDNPVLMKFETELEAVNKTLKVESI